MNARLLLPVILCACEPGVLETPTIVIIPVGDAGRTADAAPMPGGGAPLLGDVGPEPNDATSMPDAAPVVDRGPEDPCAEVRCGENARCVDGACRCARGFVLDGDRCVPEDPCADVRCGPGAACDAGECVCQPGFVPEGDGCAPAPVTPLELRTQEEVCAHWAREHVPTPGLDWEGDARADCDVGVVPDAAQANAIRRTNLYRWQAGLEPIALDVPRVPTQQACAVVLAAIGRLSHDLTNNMPCYTPAAAQGAGSSNLSGGGRLANSVDLYISDPGAGNAELGHRRWILNPAMAETAFGFKSGFGCMYSFSMSARQAVDFVAWPPPGFVPARSAQGRLHVALYGLRPGPEFRLEAALGEAGPFEEVEFWGLNPGFGRPRAAYGYAPPGGVSIRDLWTAGTVLRVALRGLADHDDVVFTTRFVECR